MRQKSKQRKVVSLKPSVAYWKALGRFIEEFASIETVMFAFLTTHSGLDARMGRALFHGMRADGGLECFKRALRVRPLRPERATEIAEALSQFKAISGLRNDVVHHASFLTNDQGRIVSNIARSGSADGPREVRVSPAILNAASDDLKKIGLHLVYAFAVPNATDAQRAEEAALTRAWLYKPPQPRPKDQPRKPQKSQPR